MRRRIAAFARDERGGLASVEVVLVSLPMLVIAFCIVQFMLLAHASIVIKQAAHAAARSALVHACQPISISSASGNLFGAVADSLWNKCQDKPEEWENAARIALIPISASRTPSSQNCDWPDALIPILTRDAVRDGLSDTLRNKACYAFTDDNVAVSIKWETQLGGVQLTSGPPPITATVQFKVPLLAPTRMIFNSGERDDGTFYWAGEESVTLL